MRTFNENCLVLDTITDETVRLTMLAFGVNRGFNNKKLCGTQKRG